MKLVVVVEAGDVSNGACVAGYVGHVVIMA